MSDFRVSNLLQHVTQWVQDSYIDTEVWQQLRRCVDHNLLRPDGQDEENISDSEIAHNHTAKQTSKCEYRYT